MHTHPTLNSEYFVPTNVRVGVIYQVKGHIDYKKRWQETTLSAVDRLDGNFPILYLD